MQNHDYIPKGDASLLAFAKTLYAYAPANFALWSVPSPNNKVAPIYSSLNKSVLP